MVDDELAARIRQLRAEGYSLDKINILTGATTYAIRVALMPGYVEAARLRSRRWARENPEAFKRQQKASRERRKEKRREYDKARYERRKREKTDADQGRD